MWELRGRMPAFKSGSRYHICLPRYATAGNPGVCVFSCSPVRHTVQEKGFLLFIVRYIMRCAPSSRFRSRSCYARATRELRAPVVSSTTSSNSCSSSSPSSYSPGSSLPTFPTTTSVHDSGGSTGRRRTSTCAYRVRRCGRGFRTGKNPAGRISFSVFRGFPGDGHNAVR